MANDIDGKVSTADTFCDTLDTGKQVVLHSLPNKSHNRYVYEYEKFVNWQKSNNTNLFDEEALLAYFSGLAKTLAPTSLWSVYSMLKKMINCERNVDIGRYTGLLAFLRQKNEGYTGKKTSMFSAEDIKKFLTQAPDSKYLATKVATLFLMCGVGTSDNLINTKVEHVRDYGTEIVVQVPDVKTNMDRLCQINCEYVHIVRNYMRLRPSGISTERFFVQYRDEKCTAQYIGKNTFAKMPQKIAEYLGLSDPEGYSGYSWKNFATKTVLLNTIQKSVVPSATSNNSPNLNIKNEEFEAGDYVFSDTNMHISHDTHVQTEDNAMDSNSTKSGHKHDAKLEDILSPETNSNKNFQCSNDSVACENRSLCQQKIKSQAEEIATLKQCIDRQNSKIESLEMTLLLLKLEQKG